MSFCLPPNPECLVKFLGDFEYFESQCQENVSVSKGHLLNTIVSGLKNVNLPIRLKTALNNLKNEPNIVITKVDKGDKVVILNSNDCCSKMEDILSDHSTYERLNKVPLKAWQQQYYRDIKIKNFERPF